jgi:hypothetical protein
VSEETNMCMKINIKNLFCFLALLFAQARASGQLVGIGGGGPVPQPRLDCIPQAQRDAIAAAIAANTAVPRDPRLADAGPASYPFQPIAGTIWQDRFIMNFVDLDSSSGILDWDCTGFTYDGHQGHDLVLRHFGEQDVGVPVFAALDGTVVARHDGEFDRNTSLNPSAVANYVILDHGGGHQSLYWHMRSNSVAVALNQAVTAGTQLGLAASSGYSDGPHLHFESRLNGVVYEPYAGNCQTSTPSRWVRQTPIRRDTYLGMFAMHGTNNVSPFLPENPPRKGTFVRTGANQPIGAWFNLYNLPANSSWRLGYYRPNGSFYGQTDPINFNNPTSSRSSGWWIYASPALDTTGRWTMELSINGTLMVTAPFLVLNPGGVPTNRPPNAFTAALDPPAPTAGDVVFCRLAVPLLDDPDYDFVRYRFQWTLNGAVVRDVTNGAFSDAVRKGIAQTGDFLSCTVTANDGVTNGRPVTVSAFVGGPVPPRLNVVYLGGSDFSLLWPTSGPPYVLEFASNLAASAWQPVTNGFGQSGGQNTVTNPASGNPRFFRLRFTY